LVEDIEKTKEELEILKMQISKVENEIVQVNKDLTIVAGWFH
jgi:peptidoglycan hydrolase CwlO-like protein